MAIRYNGHMTTHNYTREEIESLIIELKSAVEAYYTVDGVSSLTDEEFDIKQDALEAVIDTSEAADFRHDILLLIGGGDPSLGAEISGETITHKIPMLSLGKAKTEDELRKYLERVSAAVPDGVAKGFKIQMKLDGFAMSARYERGRLVSLATRGDGEQGEDVSYLADRSCGKLSVIGLPATIPGGGDYEIRGELFLTETQFSNVNSERIKILGSEFKNSRNAVVGLMSKARTGLLFPAEFTFATYGVYVDDVLVDIDSLNLGVETVRELTAKAVDGKCKIENLASVDEAIKAVNEFGKLRSEGFEYPTDGVVVKPMAEKDLNEILGFTSHHPASQIAFKYPAPTAESTILDIVLSVGKTGRVTPTASIAPADLMGTEIRNVSLHNFSWIADRDIRIGSKVLVTRANDVIPYIKAVVSNPSDSTPVVQPVDCPSCGSVLVAENNENPARTLRCTNLDCESRDMFAIRSAVGKDFLNIDGMSVATINSLTEDGTLKNISDLYDLTLSKLSESTMGFSENGNPRRLGEKRAQNILDHIEMSKTLPLDKLMSSLSIQSLGRRASKQLIAYFGTFEAIRAASAEEISQVDKFGEVKARLTHDGLRVKAAMIDKMIAAGVQFDKPEPASEGVESGSGLLTGLSFAISGPVPSPFSNRGVWVDYIEKNGGEFHSSPKADTSFMVADKDGTSSKIAKARKLGVEFITHEDFTLKF